MSSDESGLAESVEQWRAFVHIVTQLQQQLLSAVEAAGVPPQWFAVLHLLLNAPDHRLPMSRLANEVSFTSGGFSKLADRMGREGLIDRRNSSGDRRVIFATLTPAGVKAAQGAERAYREAFTQQVLAALSPEQLRVLAVACAPLRAAIPIDELDGDDAGSTDEPTAAEALLQRRRAADRERALRER